MSRTSVNKNGIFIYAALAVSAMLAGSCKSQAAAPAGPSQIHRGGGVTVEVTYLNPGGGDGPRFLVLLNTHSVDLDGYDLKSLTVLRDDKGKTSLPTEVKNDGGGHHRQVTLTFPGLSRDARSLDLTIKNIAGIAERSFHWDL